jgi:beta-galactosidase beta subunit
MGPIKIPMHIRNITLGIFVRSNNALKICDKKIKQPNAIIDVDTDIYLFFQLTKIQKITVIEKMFLILFFNKVHKAIYHLPFYYLRFTISHFTINH